jgi:hypothetical protein
MSAEMRRVLIWGGRLSEVQFCGVDSQGCFCAGPEVPGQDEIEDLIRDGEEEGEVETDDGTVCFEVRG